MQREVNKLWNDPSTKRKQIMNAGWNRSRREEQPLLEEKAKCKQRTKGLPSEKSRDEITVRGNELRSRRKSASREEA